jgi:non-heme chloroperoxidase
MLTEKVCLARAPELPISVDAPVTITTDITGCESAGPRPGAQPSEAVIANWWRQGMMGRAKGHFDGIVAFSQTDFTEDLKKITVPALGMHGDDDQIVPYADSGPLSGELLQNGKLITYKDFPHGMPTTEADTINADLLTFLQS